MFFTSGGSEAVESAWKLARQYFKVKGEPLQTKVISRDLSYHGVTMGALSITGLAAVKGMFEPLVPGAIKVPNTNTYRLPDHAADESYFAEEIEQAILREGPRRSVRCSWSRSERRRLFRAARRLLPAGP